MMGRRRQQRMSKQHATYHVDVAPCRFADVCFVLEPVISCHIISCHVMSYVMSCTCPMFDSHSSTSLSSCRPWSHTDYLISSHHSIRHVYIHSSPSCHTPPHPHSSVNSSLCCTHSSPRISPQSGCSYVNITPGGIRHSCILCIQPQTQPHTTATC